MSKGIGGHHRAFRGQTDEWLTPPHIIEALTDHRKFDLDPCAPKVRPYETALNYYTEVEDGLFEKWHGRVWLNPPYGPQTGEWLQKLKAHGDGIALIFARTETKMFFEYIWDKADALLFLRGRLTFHKVDGTPAAHNSGGPSVLVAYGEHNADRLRLCSLDGKFIDLKETSHD